MEHYFDRVCQVVIDNEDRLIIDDCKIRFEIIKSCNPQENNGRIELYNLSLATRKAVSASYSIVKLFAGYTNNKGLVEVGQGDIACVKTSRNRTEAVTQIYITEGIEKIKLNSVSLSFKDEVSLNAVLSDFSSKTGLAYKTIGIRNVKLQGGYAAIGGPDTILDELALVFKFNWSIQNGVIIIRGSEQHQQSVMLLSPATGLILNPETAKKLSRKLAKTLTPLPNVYNIQALLQPHLQVYDNVKVESDELNGLYQIKKITHTGDTRGNDWYSDMEVVAV